MKAREEQGRVTEEGTREGRRQGRNKGGVTEARGGQGRR
jgi:hypothetical protein